MIFLDPSDAAELARTGPRGDGVFAGIDPGSIAFGEPLAQLLEVSGQDLNRLLQAAAIAGHRAIGWEGLLMTLRAAIVSWHQEVTSVESSDVSVHTYERFRWCANDLRAVVTLAEALCMRLEERAADFWRANSFAPLEQEYEECAQRCDERARRARFRGEMARKDNGPAALFA
jgi:hypothetical protein